MRVTRFHHVSFPLTLGIGALCVFPLLILFIPIALLVYAIMEQAVSAVIVDNLGLSAALQRAWELVKRNFGVMALMSIIIYLGGTLLSMVISTPMMIPMFGFFFSMGSEPDMQAVQDLSRNMMLWMLAISPFLALFQGLFLTFMQSAWTLSYMRLRAPSPNAPALLEASAEFYCGSIFARRAISAKRLTSARNCCAHSAGGSPCGS